MSSRHSTYFNLLEALPLPGCALCRLALKTVDRYLESILYENVNDVAIQEGLKASQGLCPAHSERLLLIGNALGSSILYLAILRHLTAHLPDGAPVAQGWLERLTGAEPRGRGAIPPKAPCPACAQRDGAGARYLQSVEENWEAAELRDALQQSAGLCVPHLQQAMGAVRGPALALLLKRQREVWNTLSDELREFIRKNDYRFRHEGYGGERDAWQRAIRLTVGEPGVF